MWRTDQITFALRDDDTDAPIVTVDVTTPAGKIVFMAEVVLLGGTRRILLAGLHVQSGRNRPDLFGVANLLVLARAVLEGADIDELVIAGAVRTTGANPAHLPRVLRFTRAARHRSGA